MRARTVWLHTGEHKLQLNVSTTNVNQQWFAQKIENQQTVFVGFFSHLHAMPLLPLLSLKTNATSSEQHAPDSHLYNVMVVLQRVAVAITPVPQLMGKPSL